MQLRHSRELLASKKLKFLSNIHVVVDVGLDSSPTPACTHLYGLTGLPMVKSQSWRHLHCITSISEKTSTYM